jgi:hypothetical protein
MRMVYENGSFLAAVLAIWMACDKNAGGGWAKP